MLFRSDYVTLNNYHGQTFELIARLQSDLRGAGMDQPLVLNQFAPAILGTHPAMAGGVQAASHYLHSLDRFVQTPDLASACMSFWAGSDRKALLRESPPGTFTATLPFRALAFYQRMPLWRLPVPTSSTDPPYTLWAARDAGRFSVLVVPRMADVGGGLSEGAAGKEERRQERRNLRRLERRAQRRGLDDAPARAATASAVIPLLLPSNAHQSLEVERLVEGRTAPIREILRTDASGRVNLQVAPDQIVMLSSGEAAPLPPLLAAIRSDLYVHRDAQEQGWASHDAIHDGFVLALPTPRAVAHASATYPAPAPGAALVVQLVSPEGAAGLQRALRCSALVLQGVTAGPPRTLAAWGDATAAARIQASRAFETRSRQTPPIRPWPTADPAGRIRLPLPNESSVSTVRLHVGAASCDAGTQLQARVLR